MSQCWFVFRKIFQALPEGWRFVHWRTVDPKVFGEEKVATEVLVYVDSLETGFLEWESRSLDLEFEFLQKQGFFGWKVVEKRIGYRRTAMRNRLRFVVFSQMAHRKFEKKER